VNFIGCVEKHIPEQILHIAHVIQEKEVFNDYVVYDGHRIHVVAAYSNKYRFNSMYEPHLDIIYINAHHTIDILHVLEVDTVAVRVFYTFMHEYKHYIDYHYGKKLFCGDMYSRYSEYYNHRSEIEAREYADDKLKQIMSMCIEEKYNNAVERVLNEGI